MPEDFYRNVAKVAATKGAKFVLDTSGPALKAALGIGIHLPNLAVANSKV